MNTLRIVSYSLLALAIMLFGIVAYRRIYENDSQDAHNVILITAILSSLISLIAAFMSKKGKLGVKEILAGTSAACGILLFAVTLKYFDTVIPFFLVLIMTSFSILTITED
jgi:hypothetical protein